MTTWICRTCAVEQGAGTDPPPSCPICSDERQYVPPTGQRWTTLPDLQAEGHTASLADVEPGLWGLEIRPTVGIGQRALLLQTPAGNLLWDPPGYLDDAVVDAVRALGGVAAVAASHPHMYGVQVEWSRRFDGAPVWVPEADREWLLRDDAALRWWTDAAEVLPGVELHRIGGHFAGSAVARFTGADGAGVLLSGDTVACTPDEHWVSFLRSYPNKLPLSAAVVETLADRLVRLSFERLYDNFAGRVRADARTWLRRSADRYVGWVRGDFDHLTGT
ncbi:MAG: Metallo-beta-lactamase superfamily protein [Friedmanniella sp.]|nr:Metallo-beta-lactamase superfamily protein [Friedmanniella sp.]